MRLRVRFSKLGKVRFTSHRDVARIWERALRRASLPVARTEGFSPRPKLHFGLALSTGYESLAEYLDVDLVEGTIVDLAVLPEALTAALPGGLAATAVATVPPGTPSLQHAVTSSRWEVEVHDLDLATVTARTEALLAAPELVTTRQRKGKDVSDDVRPHLLHLQPQAHPAEGVLLVAELGAQNRGLRPSELVALLGDGAREGRVRRTHQFTEHDGTRCEPLPAPHALERAS
ncbi:MAG TPA: TIGR03936 family radical SAM-associated protein [Acidimicrobiales bacterium]|nr:TIGR03936 family radical SAM-associated protein [Acidimicrobiales bacterium]